MAKILKCPRCQQSMDVTSVSPGSTVRCPDCGQMARVPSGATSVGVKTVSPPIPAPKPAARGPAAPAGRERGTRIRERSRSGTMPAPQEPKKSQGGLFVGLGIGALGIVIVIIVFTMKGQGEAPPPVHVTQAPKDTTVEFKPNLPPGSDRPLVLGEGLSKPDAKPTVLSKPAENANNVNWPQLMQQLRPAGGFDNLDRPEGVAFQKVKGLGKAAYPKLVEFIDDEDTAIGIAAVAVLNAITGRDTPLPKGVSKARVKAEWQEWLKNPEAAPKPDAPKADPPK